MTSPGARDIRLHPSLEKLSRAAAEELANIAQAAIEARHRFTLAHRVRQWNTRDP